MNKLLLGAFIACLSGAGSYAQDIVHSFELSWPIFKVSNSLYNKISFIDSRTYKADIGIIDEGLKPGQVEKIVFKTPIASQFTAVMQVLTDTTARDGEIVFQLRRFRFIERLGVRYCHLSASLYTKKDDRYIPLSQLNTVFAVSAPVLKNLRRDADTLITGFLANSLHLSGVDSIAYSLRDVEHIDSIEKRHTALYTATSYPDGIYRTARAFLDQRPDWHDITVDQKKDGGITGVNARYAGGEKRKVEMEKMYAVVYKGKPYMVTEYGFYPLEKLGDEFYFTGDVRVDASLGDRVNSAFLFGLIGGLLSRSGYKAHYQVMIDHQTGGYVFVRALEPGS